jgi:hypothetical protein
MFNWTIYLKNCLFVINQFNFFKRLILKPRNLFSDKYFGHNYLHPFKNLEQEILFQREVSGDK